jgi:hypothetical protein
MFSMRTLHQALHRLLVPVQTLYWRLVSTATEAWWKRCGIEMPILKHSLLVFAKWRNSGRSGNKTCKSIAASPHAEYQATPSGGFKERPGRVRVPRVDAEKAESPGRNEREVFAECAILGASSPWTCSGVQSANYTLGSGSLIVTMMQSAEPLLRQDATGVCGSNSLSRRSLSEPEICAVFVVVADIFGEQSPQMAFVRGNDAVQQVPSAALDAGHTPAPNWPSFSTFPAATFLPCWARSR